MSKILIVEDEVKIARFVTLELEHEGYEVQAAHDGRTGLTLCESWQPDLLILDLMLPELSGIEVCRRLNERYGPVECFLDHENPFRLVISVLLSAQTTDAQVNKVTPELFRRWPTPEAMASATPAAKPNPPTAALTPPLSRAAAHRK